MSPSPDPRSIARALRAGHARLGIVGLGYVGLPLALAFSRLASVVGYDVDPDKIAALKAGSSPLPHIPAAEVARAVRAQRLHPTEDYGRLRSCSVLLICVPTPLGAHREPDLSHVRAAAAMVGRHLTKGALVVLESTTYPGTTQDVVAPILEEHSGLIPGVDFHLAYAPEREDPGSGRSVGQTPKVVGGLTPVCGAVAAAVYGLVGEAVPVSCTQTAEMTKLLENIFRCVNIALVNELKVLCDAMQIDIWEVIGAAKSKPFGFMPFYPGPGLGGHCIPVDPFYLSWKAKEVGRPTRFIELAGEVNQAMPAYVVEQVAAALNRNRLPLAGERVLLVGLAYKKNVGDMRESPALRVWALLSARGACVRYHDPLVPDAAPHVDADDPGRRSVPLRDLGSYAAIVILADHDVIDWARLGEHDTVVDTRDVLRRQAPPQQAAS